MPDIREIIRLIEFKRKTSFPWKRQEPYPQPYFAYTNGSWQPLQPSKQPTTSTTATKTFHVISWNIDFMLPYTDERMLVALNHIHSLITNRSAPQIIFFNEMLESDLALIQSQSWVQQGYHITDIDNEYWESGHYGTVTLIPKSLPIVDVFRVHYEDTKMERDGLFVDFDMGNGRVVSVCNSHLESLIADPPLRPAQIATSAKYLQRKELAGGLMGGDFNAIQPFDRTLHSHNGLKDAYLEMGGKEDSDDGFTWGQMAPVKQREMFGCSRMDKLFFCGGLEVVDFERFGYGVKVDDESVKKILTEVEGMEDAWVTDHLGVIATFTLNGGPAPKI